MKPYTIRVVYVVPKDRTEWPEARKRATEFLEDIQKWFADEMKQNGFGKKTFEIARGKDGLVTCSVIKVKENAREFQKDAKDTVNLCKATAIEKGLRPDGDNDVVMYFFESYRIDDESGKLVAAMARGGVSAGHRECFLSSIHLKLARREWLKNKEPYAGKTFLDIYDKPLPDAAFREGSGIPVGQPYTLGQLSGKSCGVMAHELGHALGITHANAEKDGTDKNRKGYLMGNGCRGKQGYFAPELTDDFCHLSRGNAEILEKSGRMKPVAGP